MGIQGVETGRQQSTAVFLAQQRMDQVKAAALIATEPPLANVTAAAFPAEPYGTIVDGAEVSPARHRLRPLCRHRRRCDSAQGLRVDVDVFYQQITARGVLATERSVRLSNVLTSR